MINITENRYETRSGSKVNKLSYVTETNGRLYITGIVSDTVICEWDSDGKVLNDLFFLPDDWDLVPVAKLETGNDIKKCGCDIYLIMREGCRCNGC